MKKKKLLYISLLVLVVLFWQKASILSFVLTQYFKYPINFKTLNLSKPISEGFGSRVSIKKLNFNKNPKAKDCNAQFDLMYSKKNTSIQNIRLNLGKTTIITNLKLIKKKDDKLFVSAIGRIEKGPINDVLACLNLHQDDLIAIAEVPKFSISTLINDGEIVMDSIAGSGDLILYNGKFKLIDIVKPIINKFARQNDEQSDLEDSKNFDKLTAHFNIKNKTVELKNIKFKNFYANAKGKGKIGFDSKIDFDLYIAGLDNYLPIEKLKLDYLLPQGLMPVKIRGTIDKPIIFPNPIDLPNSLKPGIINKLGDWIGL